MKLWIAEEQVCGELQVANSKQELLKSLRLVKTRGGAAHYLWDVWQVSVKPSPDFVLSVFSKRFSYRAVPAVDGSRITLHIQHGKIFTPKVIRNYGLVHRSFTDSVRG